MTTTKPALYDVTLIEVATRYVGTEPVDCAVFHKRDGTAVTVRLRPEQMDDLETRLRLFPRDDGLCHCHVPPHKPGGCHACTAPAGVSGT